MRDRYGRKFHCVRPLSLYPLSQGSWFFKFGMTRRTRVVQIQQRRPRVLSTTHTTHVPLRDPRLARDRASPAQHLSQPVDRRVGRGGFTIGVHTSQIGNERACSSHRETDPSRSWQFRRPLSAPIVVIARPSLNTPMIIASSVCLTLYIYVVWSCGSMSSL